MWVTERNFSLGMPVECKRWADEVRTGADQVLKEDDILLRAIVNSTINDQVHGEALILSGVTELDSQFPPADLALRMRPFENQDKFTAVVMVPTGVGAEVGGHAGDAGPIVKLFGEVCDQVITHPNVVNASDINESPANSLYVEGSVLTRLLLGNISLQPVRNNRILVVIDDHVDPLFVNAATNAVNAARATYGLWCDEIVRLEEAVRLRVDYAASGRAIGEVFNLEPLLRELIARRGSYDAVAVSSVISVPHGYHQGYFDSAGEMVNPWGGVEAMLTHTLSTLLNVPTAHSPMFESRDIANADPGIVDSRMAAEAVSLTFLQCILKGLQRSPKIVTDAPLGQAGLVDVTDISCLIMPDGCVGLPTLAALAQGIPVIAVRENRSLMLNDLQSLPWAAGQLHIVENYWEAAGVLAALKSGICPNSVRRPLDGAISSQKKSKMVAESLEKI
jgi:Protein of unknown function (DUF3326)